MGAGGNNYPNEYKLKLRQIYWLYIKKISSRSL